MDQNIRGFINKLRRRLGIQKAIYIFPLFLSVGFFIAFFHVLFGYFRPFYYAGIIGWFWILASFLSGGIYFLLHFPKEREAAHTGDKAIGQERLLTSLELRGNDTAISRLQKEDTMAHIMTCNMKEAFPYQLSLKQILAFLLAVSFFLIFLFLPSKAKFQAEKLHALKQETKAEIELLEDIKEDLEKEMDTPLAVSGKAEEIKQLLEQAKEEYISADSKQDLQKAKERLKVKLEKMAENADYPSEQTAVSDLMERAGFPPYNNRSDSNSDNGDMDIEGSPISDNSDMDISDELLDMILEEAPSEGSPISDSSNNTTGTTNTTETTNTNGNKNSSSGGKKGKNNQKNNGNSNPSSSGNKNKTSQNNAQNGHSNNNSENSGNSQTGQSNNNGENSSNSQTGGNGEKKGSNTGSGKDQGSKKGVERKSKTSQSKEKIMVIDKAIGDDENLTGAISEDGNSYQASSDQQLAFGTKKNLDEVARDYAESAFTAIDNNSIPYSMKSVVEAYFNNIY